MKKFFTLISGVLLITTHLAWSEGFTLSSSSFTGQVSNDQLYSGFGCTGKNISPDLSWINPPEGTKSFAITLYDPDAPTGGGWWHWLLFNIPAEVLSLPADAGNSTKKLAPKESVQSITSFGSFGYGGAAPPKGDPPHQYILTIYALDIEKLNLVETSTPNLVGFKLNAHTIEKASIIAYYSH